MDCLTVGLAVVFALLVGRNDGATLVALALRSLHRRTWWPAVILAAATVLVPAAGYDAVARTLADMFTVSAGTAGAGLAVLLMATIATLFISTATGIPTSITLALVGASAGTQIAHGALEADRVLRILVLAAIGPVVAYLLALTVTSLLTLFRGPQLERTVRWQQITGFVAPAIAYGANDGQKILAVLSVLGEGGVAGAATDPRIIGLTIVCFTAGTLLGLRRSANRLRRGVLHPKPYQVASTLLAAASAVLTGSALAAPMSMSQSITGALIGSAPPREWRRVRWEQSRPVFLAWLWTLPVAAITGWGLTLMATALSH
jgi:PiT family inorganic phosphate transporter